MVGGESDGNGCDQLRRKWQTLSLIRRYVDQKKKETKKPTKTETKKKKHQMKCSTEFRKQFQNQWGDNNQKQF